MKKLDSLRAALTAAVPRLARTPEALEIYIDKGSIAATGAPPGEAGAEAWEYRYKANLVLLDFTEEPDLVFRALLAWLRLNERRLLDRYHNGEPEVIRFDADILDASKVDLDITLDLTEPVTTAFDDGAPVFTHHDDAPIVAADDFLAGAVDTVTVGGEVLVGGD